MLVAGSLAGGGIARTVATLANAWVEQGRTVSVLAFDEPGTHCLYPLDERVKLIRAGLLGESRGVLDAIKRNVRRLVRLRRRIVDARPDAVIAFGDQTNVLVLLALMGAEIPVLVSERIDPRRHRVGLIWSTLRQVTYRLARQIVVQTDGVRSAFSAHLRARTITIPNPVPVPAPVADKAAKPVYAAANGPVVMGMGRLHRQKGFDVLLEAFARVSERRSEWTMVIWGEGPARPELEEQCRRLGLSDRVSLPGVTDDPMSQLASADLFILSSRYEGFPNALCEAMAVGLAVVATDCDSGPADIVRSGEDGLLVPADDVDALAQAMDVLMGDVELRERFGYAARAVVERFSVPRILAAWDEILPDGS